MRAIDLLRMCFKNLFKRFARTFMTVSGVVIGTCSIIVMLSLGLGLDQAFDTMIQNMADLTIVYVYPSYSNNTGGNNNDTVKLNDATMKQIQQLEHVEAATPVFNIWSDKVTLYAGDYVYSGSLTGVYMDQLEHFGYTLSEGRFVNKSDENNCVLLGEEAIYDFREPDEDWYSPYDDYGNKLPPRLDLTKEELRIAPSISIKDEKNDMISSIDYDTILGDNEFQSKYAKDLNHIGTFQGSYTDNTMWEIYIDIGLAKSLVEEANDLNDIDEKVETDYQFAKVRVDSMENTVLVEDLIKEMGLDADSNMQIREQFQTFTTIIQLVLGGLAAISLFVAAIGISNTMIMSITERTKEIGVMKVLGCAIGNIRTLFLLEAGSIGFLGGVIGIGTSYAISHILNNTLPMLMMNNSSGFGDLFSMGTKISIITPWLIIAALIFSTLVGLVSGFYPANKAVKISPLEAISR